MKRLDSVTDVKTYVSVIKKKSQSIGFVPTMGALHDGHFALIKQSLATCDVTIVSIFVNPTQFSPNEDFNSYPTPLKTDLSSLKALGVDAVFTPTIDVIYPEQQYKTIVYVPSLSKRYCGQSRPHFFQGVCMVVLRLFNIVRPDFSFFGEKDFQQLSIIKKMVSDLFIPTTIISYPIIREKTGLALSSRNQYLSKNEHTQAQHIYYSLNVVKKDFENGSRNVKDLLSLFYKSIGNIPSLRIDYVSIINPKTLYPRKKAQKNDRLLCAVYLHKTRLIDNISL